MHTGATRPNLTRLAAAVAVLAAMLAFAGVHAAGAKAAHKAARAVADCEETGTILRNDEYFVDEGSTFNSSPHTVIENDDICFSGNPYIDPTGQPSHGDASMSFDGSFSYTPDPGFVGDDSFRYYFQTFSDLAGRARTPRATVQTATVTLHVQADCSNVARNDAYSVVAGQTLTVPAPGFLGNDTLCFGQVTLVDGFQHGNGGVNSNGSFTYTPDPGFTGADSFTYRLGAIATVRPLAETADDTATVTIIVTPDCEVNLADDAYSLDQDTTLKVDDEDDTVLVNDTTCGPVADIIVDQQPQHGKVTTTGAGTFTYTPESGYNGTDSFTYELQRPVIIDDKAPRKVAKLKTVGTVNLVINPLVPVTEQTIPPVVTTAPPTTPTTEPPVTEPPVTEAPPTEVPPTEGTIAPPTTSGGVSGTSTSPALARTGVNFTGILLAGFGLVLLGLVLAAESRRRKHT